MLRMLRHVAEVARAAGVGPVALASSDADAAALAATFGIGHVDDGGLTWNEGLAYARARVEPPPDAVLYLAGDLPLVEAAEIRRLVEACPGRGVAIGRAHDGGTNALAVRPAGSLEPRFGAAHSARAHADAGLAAGLEVVIVDLPGVALDVDTPADARRAGLL